MEHNRLLEKVEKDILFFGTTLVLGFWVWGRSGPGFGIGFEDSVRVWMFERAP